MGIGADRTASTSSQDHVRLVYHYRDGHDFTTDPMLRTEALAYMPLLRAVRVDAEHFEASFGSIELRAG